MSYPNYPQIYQPQSAAEYYQTPDQYQRYPPQQQPQFPPYQPPYQPYGVPTPAASTAKWPSAQQTGSPYTAPGSTAQYYGSATPASAQQQIAAVPAAQAVHEKQPWSILIPGTEQASPQFIAYLSFLFDAIDQRFEPRNTGLLEAFKIVEFWKLESPEQDHSMFIPDNYRLMGLLWGFCGAEHVMLPCDSKCRPATASSMVAPINPGMEIIFQGRNNSAGGLQFLPAMTRRGFVYWYFTDLCQNPSDVKKYMKALFPNGISASGLPDVELFQETSTGNLGQKCKELAQWATARAIQSVHGNNASLEAGNTQKQQEQSRLEEAKLQAAATQLSVMQNNFVANSISKISMGSEQKVDVWSQQYGGSGVKFF
ncbi:hypothetical protein GQ44DRAFT_773232 [Phaeosphaeriaceae sp. PMI808]|nr:hypothetical protein GQ44DRAFT_773232 [Phaeosphaeriaceae sp. PMI808]